MTSSVSPSIQPTSFTGSLWCALSSLGRMAKGEPTGKPISANVGSFSLGTVPAPRARTASRADCWHTGPSVLR